MRGDGPRGWSGGDGGDVLCNEHILFFQIPVVGGLWGFSLGFSSQIDNSGVGVGWTISGDQSMEITQPWERIGCGAGQDRPSFLFPNWTQSSANYVVLGLEGLWVLGCEVCWVSVLPSVAVPLRPWLPGTSTPHPFLFNKQCPKGPCGPEQRFPAGSQFTFSLSEFLWNVLPHLFSQVPLSPVFYRCPWPWVAHSTVYIVNIRNKDVRLATASGVSPPGKLTGCLLKDGWLCWIRHLALYPK